MRSRFIDCVRVVVDVLFDVGQGRLGPVAELLHRDGGIGGQFFRGVAARGGRRAIGFVGR